MRTLGIALLTIAAGCSAGPFAGGTSDRRVPPEAVLTYAKAHGLSRDEARRELETFRDADYLKDLRQTQGKPLHQDH